MSGDPVDPKSPIVGYPRVVQVVVPVFVTVTNPVMVPAAPCPWLGVADIRLQPGVAVELEVVDEMADVDVVVVVDDDEELVVVGCRCAVVVVEGAGDGLEHAAKATPALATSASARRRGLTPRSPRA
ncbi:MAG TPA: hypothetical protein VIX84_13540, partial [Acidimicrobiales bacterium]